MLGWEKYRHWTILLFLFSALGAAPLPAQDTITIVQLDSFSGPGQDVGYRSLLGTQFAAEEINAAGGILGKKIKILPQDSELQPDAAVRKATTAIGEQGAKIILQFSSSAASRALMDVAQKYKVIFVTLGAEAESLTGKDFNLYFFRTCFATGNRSRAYAEFFKTKPWRKFYLLNRDDAFGHAVADDFKAVMTKEIPKSKIVGEDFPPLATRDLGPYLAKIQSSEAEVIFTGNRGQDLEVLMKQGAQMGVPARYATFFLDDPILLARLGQAAVGSLVNSPYLPTVETLQNTAFLEKWHKQHKDTQHPWPTSNIGYGYNGMMFLFAAIKKAQSFNADAIIKAWEGMEYNGLLGKQIMRACDHQVLMPGPIAEIQAKSKLFSCPFPGRPLIIPMDKVAVPLAEAGNPRCK